MILSKLQLAFVVLLSAILSVVVVWLVLPYLQPAAIPVSLEMETNDSGMVGLTWGDSPEDYVALSPTDQLAPAEAKTHRLELTSTGEANPESSGKEIWIQGIWDERGTRLPPQYFTLGDGWQIRDDMLYTSGEPPGTLVGQGNVGGLRIQFLSHAGAGKVLVSWDGREQLIDLYAATIRSKSVLLGPRFWRADMPPVAVPRMSLYLGDGIHGVAIRRLTVETNPPQTWHAADLAQAWRNDPTIKIDSATDETILLTTKATGVELALPDFAPIQPAIKWVRLLLVWLGATMLLLTGLYFSIQVAAELGIMPASSPAVTGAGGQPPSQVAANRLALVAVAGILLLFSLFVVFRVPDGDVVLPYQTAYNYLTGGLPVMYDASGPRTDAPRDARLALGRDGYVHNVYEPGLYYLYYPLMRLGRAIDARLSPADSYWTAGLALVELPHLLILPAVGLLMFMILRRLRCSMKTAAWVALLGVLSTSLPVYATPYIRDGIGVPIILAAFYFALRARQSGSSARYLWAAGAGTAAGAAILIKLTVGAVVVPLFLYLALTEYLQLRNAPRTWLATLGAFALPATAGLAVLTAYNWLIFGTGPLLPVNASYYSNVSQGIPIYEGLFGLLLSPGKGVFWYNPLLWLVFLAWRRFKTDFAPEFWFFVAHALIVVLPMAGQSIWSGEFAWGPRYLAPLLPWGLIVVGYWLQVDRARYRWWLATGLAVVGFLVQLPALLISQYSYEITRLVGGNAEFFYGPHRHFWPVLSPIVVYWKALLAKLSHGAWFGYAPLWANAWWYPAPPMIDFAEGFAWIDSFWYRVVFLHWHALTPMLAIAGVAIAACVYLLIRALQTERDNPAAL